MEFAPCDAAGKAYEVRRLAGGTGKPADGQLFLKVEDEEHPWRYDGTLEEYSASSGNWTAVPLEYCRITAAGAQEYLPVGHRDRAGHGGTAGWTVGSWTGTGGVCVSENGLRVRAPGG